MGPKSTCGSEFVEILEANENQEFVSARRYCGDDKPAVFVSTQSQIKVHHLQTLNFGGTGWTINFMGVHEGLFNKQIRLFLLQIDFIFLRRNSSRLVKSLS
jgi:CUB domain